MRISILATRITREIIITIGRNFYKEPAISITTHDNLRGHGDGLFIFAMNFQPWSLPGIIYYNATQRMDADRIKKMATQIEREACARVAMQPWNWWKIAKRIRERGDGSPVY